MVNFNGLQVDLAKKLSITMRSVNRRIKYKEDATLQPRHVAALMVAAEAGLSVKKYASAEELAELRAAQGGSQSPVHAAQSAAVPSQASPAPRRRAAVAAPRQASRKKGRDVMVVHGRDEKMKDAIFAFLKALDLRPLEWTSGIRETGSANPSVQQIVDALFGKASAVVVLLTPDDEARLRPEFREPHDPPHEVNLTGQARPNVLFEAGMAISSHPDRTVMVQIGEVRPFTDIGGSYITHMNNSLAKRKELVAKLGNACAVDTSNDDWRDSARGGDFEIKKDK
jgi:predicted nucleotide-binding protein